jgi:CheY-like chemotaxis protein
LAGRILYVEDEAVLRHAGLESLATTGLDVVAADSAEMALTILASDGWFDALVTDIALPGRTGVQLARAVRETRPDFRVLYVTGYAGEPDPDHTPAPSEPVLRKPFRPDTLRLRVAELLERPESRGGAPVQGS